MLTFALEQGFDSIDSFIVLSIIKRAISVEKLPGRREKQRFFLLSRERFVAPVKLMSPYKNSSLPSPSILLVVTDDQRRPYRGEGQSRHDPRSCWYFPRVAKSEGEEDTIMSHDDASSLARLSITDRFFCTEAVLPCPTRSAFPDRLPITRAGTSTSTKRTPRAFVLPRAGSLQARHRGGWQQFSVRNRSAPCPAH